MPRATTAIHAAMPRINGTFAESLVLGMLGGLSAFALAGDSGPQEIPFTVEGLERGPRRVSGPRARDRFELARGAHGPRRPDLEESAAQTVRGALDARGIGRRHRLPHLFHQGGA